MKSKNQINIYIVGAGISGLIAAQILENHGYLPIILEATDRVGGRVKTDIIEGYQLDHGFQVMLEAYPKAKEYLDYEKLDLQKLLPGAVIFKNGDSQTLGDPLRALSLAIPTVLASAGSIRDKIKILKLNNDLAAKSLEEIFNTEEQTTLEYLQNFGFSNRIINTFFKPFFSGIFLEVNLQTSSRMFEFVYKMFGEGLAVIPKAGIGAISEQLKSNLKNTTFKFNTKVKQITNESIILEDGSLLNSDSTIIATEASPLIANLSNQQIEWKGVDNLYFEVDTMVLEKPIIGLFQEENGLINNIFYPTSIATQSKGTKTLLSVSVVKEHQLSEQELVNAIKKELSQQAKIENCRFLKRYRITKALPRLSNLRYSMAPTETRLSSSIFLAGDQQLNGSLNAAMISGERAALGAIKVLEGGLVD
ncbi:NAD(P)/FAD-dependent oxidoreductase [Leeuwenhoekiella sp. W20_SRS_FM14]|uniref:NAD(P)/FAD-dependent oxidoreductase n=1 Tax=Leeuwenhoekiella sp. W20_SRS_FM14 TaxID=3240270 RepID=UPI003F94D05E